MHKISIDRLYLAYLKGRVDGIHPHRRTLSKEELLEWMINELVMESQENSDSDLDM